MENLKVSQVELVRLLEYTSDEFNRKLNSFNGIDGLCNQILTTSQASGKKLKITRWDLKQQW